MDIHERVAREIVRKVVGNEDEPETPQVTAILRREYGDRPKCSSWLERPDNAHGACKDGFVTRPACRGRGGKPTCCDEKDERELIGVAVGGGEETLVFAES